MHSDNLWANFCESDKGSSVFILGPLKYGDCYRILTSTWREIENTHCWQKWLPSSLWQVLLGKSTLWDIQVVWWNFQNDEDWF